MDAETRQLYEDEIRPRLRVSRRAGTVSMVCPDPINLLYDDVHWFLGPRYRRTPPSDFMRIRRTAELNNWTVDYLDHGIGHDTHVLANPGRGTLIVDYRSGRAVHAELNHEPIDLTQLLPTLGA